MTISLAICSRCDSLRLCQTKPEALPLDLAAAHAMILAERAARVMAESERDASRSSASSPEAFIVYVKLEIEKLHRPSQATQA
jgi:hypothetical protein